VRKSLTNYNAYTHTYTHTHTHTHTHNSQCLFARPSVRHVLCLKNNKIIKEELKVGKIFFLNEYSEMFSSFFYVNGFEVIP
jgi:hypothetical protein